MLTVADRVAAILVPAIRDPVKFGRIWLGWQPHQGQVRWLQAPRRPTKVLVAGRRWGKSEVAAVESLHFALTHPGSRQCCVSVTLDQARISFDTILTFAEREPAVQSQVEAVRMTPFPTIRLRNRAEITVRTVAREGVYLRGHHFDRVIVDEADYLSPRLIDEVIRMTLADTGGQLVLISTPRSRSGVVYRELERAQRGDPSVYAQTGSTFENPNVDHAYILTLRDRMTAAAWAREIEGQYVDDDLTVFRWEYIARAYESADYELPAPPSPGRRYVQGVDLAKATDWTVHCVLEATSLPYRLVHFERYQRSPYPAVAARIRELHERYACQLTLVDQTGVGEAVLDEVRDIAQGFTFTARSKVELITNLVLALEKGTIIFPFVRELVDELAAYQWDDDKLTTDCVMALALAAWAAGPRGTVEYAPSIWG